MARKSNIAFKIIAVIVAVGLYFKFKKPASSATLQEPDSGLDDAGTVTPDNTTPDSSGTTARKAGTVSSGGSVSKVTSSDGNVGIVGHNPFNLRQTKISQHWNGEIGTLKSTHLSANDVGFVNFSDWPSGARAGLKNMKHVIAGGADTIRKYIAKESPASDGNAPGPYADTVAAAVGISADATLDFTNKDQILAMATAIEKEELGSNNVPDWSGAYDAV